MSTLTPNGPDANQIKDGINPTNFFRFELPNMPTPKKDNGWVDGGLCPFHKDRHAGNFRVNLTNGAFTCFSCGAKGGDIIAFMMLRYKLSFGETLEELVYGWEI